MRIGAPVSGFRNAREWVQLHIDRELGAAYWPLPVEASSDEEAAYVSEAKAADLVIAEVGIWNNVLDSDRGKREANIQYAIARLRTADRVGARCCVNVAGSRGARWDGPHPKNITEETFRMIVATTQRIIDEAQPRHTAFSLEPMPWMYPYDIESLERLIEAVDREAFGVHVDMVNLVNAFDKVYRTGEYTRAFIGRFSGMIRSVHAKDVRLTDELTLHIEEALPGEGIFDFDALLTECAALRDIPVMAEHLETDAEYRRAVDFLKKRSAALGIVPSIARSACV